MTALLGALMGFLLLSGVVSAIGPQTTQPSSTATTPVATTYSASDPSYTLTMTAYNAVPGQTDSTPFETASGAYSNPEVVAARSQDLAGQLPFGTIIAISGPSEDSSSCGYNTVSSTIGYRVIADTMNRAFTKRVDILMGTDDNYVMPNGKTENASDILGLCHNVTVHVVGHIDISNPANLPKTQAALAALVNDGDSSVAFNN